MHSSMFIQGTRLYGCWFHFTQAIWKHIQKYGLDSSYRHVTDLESFLRQLMAIPFLPGDLIQGRRKLLPIGPAGFSTSCLENMRRIK